MPGYFLDSSALVKFYHRETGTPEVDRIVNGRASAFAIKVRTGSIDREDADLFLRQFRRDVVNGKLQVFSIGEAEFSMGELLVERYAFTQRLRALDALQLAVALELRNQKLADHFVAADAILCEVAGIEGFSIINPEQG